MRFKEMVAHQTIFNSCLLDKDFKLIIIVIIIITIIIIFVMRKCHQINALTRTRRLKTE